MTAGVRDILGVWHPDQLQSIAESRTQALLCHPRQKLRLRCRPGREERQEMDNQRVANSDKLCERRGLKNGLDELST